VLVALPASSFAGARIDAELVGGFSDPSGLVLVARLAGASLPIDAALRTVGRISPDAAWIDARHASERAAAARRAFRERRGRGRIVGGLAWRPPEGMSHESLRSGGVYSKAERSLDRLPPRFLRGLEGMLDPDERLHYSIERPWQTDAGLLTRVRGGRDHRSGLLLLTDRQILWFIDHSNPNSYLFDWGVDLDMMPVEQLTGGPRPVAEIARLKSVEVGDRSAADSRRTRHRADDRDIRHHTCYANRRCRRAVRACHGNVVQQWFELRSYRPRLIHRQH
jgi:hypothetical protein